MLLTDKEIKELPVPDEIKELMKQITSRVEKLAREVAGNIELAYLRGKQENNEAQLKKVVEWGNEECPHPELALDSSTLTHKHECSECWQSLLEEVK